MQAICYLDVCFDQGPQPFVFSLTNTICLLLVSWSFVTVLMALLVLPSS